MGGCCYVVCPRLLGNTTKRRRRIILRGRRRNVCLADVVDLDLDDLCGVAHCMNDEIRCSVTLMLWCPDFVAVV